MFWAELMIVYDSFITCFGLRPPPVDTLDEWNDLAYTAVDDIYRCYGQIRREIIQSKVQGSAGFLDTGCRITGQRGRGSSWIRLKKRDSCLPGGEIEFRCGGWPVLAFPAQDVVTQ